jgi:hypothetical protein
MIPRQRSWHGQLLTIRWCVSSGHWVLRRGQYRVASSRDWWEMWELAWRIADRERRAAARDRYLHERTSSDV